MKQLFKTILIIIMMMMIICLLQIATPVIADTIPTTYWAANEADAVFPNAYGEYEIRTPRQLAWTAGVVNGTITTGHIPTPPQGFNIRIMNDIDLGGKLWVPIGNANRKFTGNVRGNHYNIKNLTINTTNSYQGLFGYYYSSSLLLSTMAAIRIVDANIKGGFYVGALVGYNEGVISGCSATGTVSGKESVGGLVGTNVKTDSEGMIGGGSMGLISESCANTNVTGEKGVGGLVGSNSGRIYECYAIGNVASLSTYCYGFGGLVGANWQYGTLRNCYARGDVTNSNPASGTYNASTGGLVGFDFGTNTRTTGTIIEYCYSTGKVTCTGSDVGSFLGADILNLRLNNCYFNVESGGQELGIGRSDIANMLVGKSTDEMKKLDFALSLNEWRNDATWTRFPDINDSYPVLKWQIDDRVLKTYVIGDMQVLLRSVNYTDSETITLTLSVLNNSLPTENIIFLVAKDASNRVLNISSNKVSDVNNADVTISLDMPSSTETIELIIWNPVTLQPFTEKLRI